MRIIVILSPTNKRGTKTEYTKLRKFLISDGYLRISKEVFMRITNNRKGAEKHYRRLMDYKPKTGIVRVFKLTEKQYAKVDVKVETMDKINLWLVILLVFFIILGGFMTAK